MFFFFFLVSDRASSCFSVCSGEKQTDIVTCFEQCWIKHLSFFKDLGSSDLRKDVYVVAHIFRIGKSCCPRQCNLSLKVTYHNAFWVTWNLTWYAVTVQKNTSVKKTNKKNQYYLFEHAFQGQLSRSIMAGFITWSPCRQTDKPLQVKCDWNTVFPVNVPSVCE